MRDEPQQVMRVVVRAKGRSGERYAIVELTGGELGITCDEQMLQTVRFARDDMDGCIREFIRRTGIGGERAHGRGE